MSYTITNNIMYVRDDTGNLVPVSMIASGADQTIQAIKDTASAAEAQIDTKVSDANAAIVSKADEQAARIPEVTTLAEAVNELKDDLVGYAPYTKIVDTNTGIDNFDTTKKTGTMRANMFPATSGVTAVEFVIGARSNVSIGTIDISTNTYTEIIPNKIYEAGKHKVNFDNPINTTDTVKIYVNVTSGIFYSNKNGVGMWDVSANKLFGGWELSYALIVENKGYDGLIKQVGDLEDRVEKLESNKLPIKYGEIIIPSVIHVAVGRECNLWWDSIAFYNRGDKSVYFECETDFGGVYENCFRVTPTASEVGNHTIRIVSRDSVTREVISDVTCNIVVIDTSSDNGNTKSILMMGDSRTWQSFRGSNGTGHARTGYGDKDITTEVLNLCNADDGYNIVCIGDKISTLNENVRNLASSGQKYSYPTRIFREAGGVSSYCESNGLEVGHSLDIATIMFGVNDIMDWTNQKIGFFPDCLDRIDKIVNNAKTLIDMILETYSSCKIVLIIEPTTCVSQDGFPNLSNGFARFSGMELETALKVLRKSIINTFDNKKYHNNVILSSAGVWCDRLYGYPYDLISVSKRSNTKKEIWCNNIHPHTDGYKQIADGIYSTIKSLFIS